jgi:hypothetical protein
MTLDREVRPPVPKALAYLRGLFRLAVAPAVVLAGPSIIFRVNSGISRGIVTCRPL